MITVSLGKKSEGKNWRKIHFIFFCAFHWHTNIHTIRVESHTYNLCTLRAYKIHLIGQSKWPNGTYILAAAAKSLGHARSYVILTKESIRQAQRRHRVESAAEVLNSFSTGTPLIVYWDGKLLPSLIYWERYGLIDWK